MLVNRVIADYQVTKGRALLLCGRDGDSQRAMQQGFLDATELGITALYSSEEEKQKAGKRIQDERVTCTVGTLGELPSDDGAFDLVIAGYIDRVNGLHGVPARLIALLFQFQPLPPLRQPGRPD